MAAVPSIRVVNELPTARSQRVNNLSRKKLVKELLDNTDSAITPKHVFEQEPEPEYVAEHEPVAEPVPDPVQVPCCDSMEEIIRLRGEIDRYLQEQIDLKLRIQILEVELQRQKQSDSAITSSALESKFKDVLTVHQLEIILGEKERVKWKEDELSRAFTIR